MEKNMEVYFNEFNTAMGNTVYLPLVSGLLSSYSKTIPKIKENYEFMPFLFMRDDPEKIFSQYKNPSVAAFSSSMWNSNLNLEIASRVKKKFPESLIVFGGPDVPFDAERYFQINPFIDITVRGEGEKTFSEILERFIESRDFEGIDGTSYRKNEGKYVKNKKERELAKELDIFPSPYLDGTFDKIIEDNPELKFQSIVETNRGCPFLCSYCFWGQGGLNKKIRFYGLDRVKDTMDWIAQKKLEYVVCADANFGMFKRDLEIAQSLVEIKKKYGFPEKFRVNYGKNSEDKIFDIGKLLHENDMEKGITLSRQTNSPIAAANVNRKNIKMETYTSLQKKYDKANIPTYTELILGLPGETYDSFTDGLETILQAGINNQIFVYHCQVYPNTELADKEYQKKHGIITKKVALSGIHSSLKPEGSIEEYEELITSTNSMPEKDWIKSTKMSWIMQMFNGLKLGFFPSHYLFDNHKIKYTELYRHLIESEPSNLGMFNKELENLGNSVNSILNQDIYRSILPEFGTTYWEPEEAGYLRLTKNKDLFYKDFLSLTEEFLKSKRENFNEEILKEVFEYQKARIPYYNYPNKLEYSFEYNIPEYFDNYLKGNKVELQKKPQIMALKNVKDFKGNKEEFAIQVLLRGRKSNKILYPVEFNNL
jgi:putative methyltransferase